MGRGLSELQKTILELAWHEKEKHRNASKDKELVARWLQWDHDNFKRYLLPYDEKPIPPAEFAPFIEDNWMGYAWIADIFVRYYHWIPCSITRRGQSKFSKSEIGMHTYMAAYIAVRKALTRLQSRKLISISGDQSSYALTSEGHDLMAKLLEPKSADKVEMRYLKDVNLLPTGEYMHHRGKIIEVSRYEAERMLRSGVFEMV